MDRNEIVRTINYMNKLLPIGTTEKEIKEYIDKGKIKKNWYKKNKIIFDNGIKLLKEENLNYIELHKMIKSNNEKSTRIKKRIYKMIKNQCWFCTYTIEDKYMNKDHARKLKEINKGKNYIINVDYGKTTNRKHYHGIIESEEEPKKWEYGYCKMIPINLIEEKEIKNITKYINKLTAHTLKDSTKREKIIYSRARAIKN